MKRCILCLVAFAVLAACQRHAEADLNNLDGMLRSELVWLTNERTGRGSVIFKEPNSGKFIQFLGNDLFVDLPHQPLSGEEMARADVIMERFGVAKESYPLGDGADRYIQIAFQKDLNGDIEQALRIADMVFREVYLFPPDATIRAIRVR